MTAKHSGHFTFKSAIDSWGVQIVRIFHGDWIDCWGTSAVLCL